MSPFLTTEHPKSVVWLLQMCIKLQKTREKIEGHI